MFEIISIPAFKDNYIWLGVNRTRQQAFVVDPGDATPVLAYLNKHHLTLTDVLLTHKHPDHTGGVPALLSAYPKLAVYAHARENLSYTTHLVKDKDVIQLKVWPEAFNVMYIPGHTMGHVAYYAKPALFCGDTLFSGGCGKVFEGTPEDMLTSLERLAALPNDTLVYCGHEYTLNNLRFATCVEPENPNIASYASAVEKLRLTNRSSLPSKLLIEKLVNPFLRCGQAAVIASVEKRVGHSLSNTVDVFHALREWKNAF